METRKITIISTKGQKKTTIETAATTVAELKVDMNKAGIEFEGMALYEGVSKTTLINDDSVLPSNLPFKGTVTNNLLIMLTVKDKKITSGAMTRTEAYAAIKTKGLQGTVFATYGKNFTQCSTDALIDVISKNTTPSAPVAPSAPAVTTRNEAYAAIKAQGLGDAIKAKFGKNFTTCGTVDLCEFVNAQSGVAPTAKAVAPKAAPVAKAAPAPYVEPKLESPFSDVEITIMQKSIFGK